MSMLGGCVLPPHPTMAIILRMGMILVYFKLPKIQVGKTSRENMNLYQTTVCEAVALPIHHNPWNYSSPYGQPWVVNMTNEVV